MKVLSFPSKTTPWRIIVHEGYRKYRALYFKDRKSADEKLAELKYKGVGILRPAAEVRAEDQAEEAQKSNGSKSPRLKQKLQLLALRKPLFPSLDLRQYVTIPELAQLSGFTKKQIWLALQRGEIPGARRTGRRGHWVMPRSGAEKWFVSTQPLTSAEDLA